MPTSRPPLSYDVFVAPEKPFIAPPSRVGDPPAWDPTTSTLIFGASDAVLVESLMTVREATALADWVALHERRLTTIYITHGHGDHHLRRRCVREIAQDLPADGRSESSSRSTASTKRCQPRLGRWRLVLLCFSS